MSAGRILTGGLGAFSSAPYLLTLGYGTFFVRNSTTRLLIIGQTRERHLTIGQTRKQITIVGTSP